MELIDAAHAATDYLDRWLPYQLDRTRQPGIQVAIRVGEELVYSRAFGVSNVETGEKLTTDHLFHVASHSKTFTATAIMQLWEQGRLRLDDTVGQWVPELVGTPAGEYTVRELLGHNAGIIRDGEDSRWWSLGKEFPDRATLLEVASGDAVYGTNEHFKYSNIGYSLLGEIVASVAGVSYNDYVTTQIVEPLRLAKTGPEVPAERVAELAGAHTARFFGDDTLRVIPDLSTHAEAAATGFYSTAEEITAYMACHAYGREELLRDATKRLMQRRESRITKGGEQFYGLGFQMREFNDRLILGHSGGWPGHITRTWLDPESGLCVSVLGNCLGAWSTEWATAIVGLIDFIASQGDAPEGVDGVDPARFEGRFAGMWGLWDVAQIGGHLYEVYPDGMAWKTITTPLTIVDEHTLQPEAEAGYGSVGEPLRYEFDGGRVVAVWSGGERWLPIDDYLAAREA